MTTTIETTSSSKSKPARAPRHGVNIQAVFDTIGAVKAQPELGKFQFRATNRWLSGTHSRTRMEPFSGAGGEHQHKRVYEYDADHPAVLCGADDAPTPVELVLHALAGCLVAGIANVAAARGVTLKRVTTTLEGDIDLRGIFGVTDEVRNGFEKIAITFDLEGDAPPDVLKQIVEQSRARSAVFDVVTNGVPVAIDVVA